VTIAKIEIEMFNRMPLKVRDLMLVKKKILIEIEILKEIKATYKNETNEI
jgi:hypothetical protein